MPAPNIDWCGSFQHIGVKLGMVVPGGTHIRWPMGRQSPPFVKGDIGGFQ